MGKIYYIMGKSSSGKDTIFKELLNRVPGLRRVVPYTTRPRREGEENGVEYFFTDEEQTEKLEKAGRIIELRAYDTACGVWKYFTADDGQVDLGAADYLMIGTLEAYEKMIRYYGYPAPLRRSGGRGAACPRSCERAAAGAAEVQGAVPPFPCGRGGFFGGKAARTWDTPAVLQRGHRTLFRRDHRGNIQWEALKT